MLIRSLELHDFRSYESAHLTFGPGLTVIIGENGQGKTNLLEAISWISGMGSFRGVADDVLVRLGADAAVVRAEVEHVDGREQLCVGEEPFAFRHHDSPLVGLRRSVDEEGALALATGAVDRFAAFD